MEIAPTRCCSIWGFPMSLLRRWRGAGLSQPGRDTRLPRPISTSPPSRRLAWGLLALLRSPRFRASKVSRDHFEPEEILARRFAPGEIDEAEFDRRLAVLHGHSE